MIIVSGLQNIEVPVIGEANVGTVLRSPYVSARITVGENIQILRHGEELTMDSTVSDEDTLTITSRANTKG